MDRNYRELCSAEHPSFWIRASINQGLLILICPRARTLHSRSSDRYLLPRSNDRVYAYIIIMTHKSIDVQTAILFLQEITGRQNLVEQANPSSKQKSASHFKGIHKDNFPKFKQKQKEANNKDQDEIAVFDPNTLMRTAQGIEQTLQKFYLNQQPDMKFQHNSTETRLNIYFKQNSRILERIQNQNEIMRRNIQGNIEEKEARLNRQFMFTVKDDCRDQIMMSIQKTEQKLSKMMEDSDMLFKVMLLVMVDNELKIYVDKSGEKILRTIKMYEINNIAYNQQPFKCMVISFSKDQSKPAEHLYLKYANNQEHDKWDRILYINYKVSEMKQRKDKLFLSDFRKEEFKTNETEVEVKKYEPDLESTINGLLAVQKVDDSKARRRDNDREKDSKGDTSLRDNKTVSDRDISQNVVNPMQLSVPTPSSQKHMTSSLRYPVQNLPSFRADNNSVDLERANTNEHLNIDPLTPRHDQEQPSFDPNRMNVFMGQDQRQEPSEMIQVSFVENTNQKYMIPSSEPPQPNLNKHQVQQQPSKVERLQKLLENGIVVTKHNFLSSSSKILFPDNKSIKYADQALYRQYVLDKKNGSSKEQVFPKNFKSLPIQSIEKIETKSKGDSNVKLTIHHGGGKKFQVTGPVREFCDWLKLKCAQI